MQKIKRATIALLMAGVVACSAAEPKEWNCEVIPSLWPAGFSGKGTVNDRDVRYDRSSADLLDRLKIGGSLAGKIVWRQFVFGGQIDGYSLSTSDVKVDNLPLVGRMDTDMIFGELAAGYVFSGWKEGQTFALALGARYCRFASDLEIDDAEPFHHTKERWDPIVILWPSFPLFPSKINGLSLAPAFSIGGGGDSKLVYELFPQLRYQINEHIVARFGYRSIGYRSKTGGNELDFDLAGFIAGLGATF